MTAAIGSADTIAAVATPAGVGGIGIVRLSGSKALDVALRVARLDGRTRPRPRYAHLVRVVDPGRQDALVDEALLLYMPGPASYTGEDVVELQGHGGPVVQRAVLDVVLRQGARPAAPGEFSLRAFLNGRIDLAQAEAVADLVAAPTPDAVAVAANQLAGRLSDAVGEMRRGTLDLLAQMEAEVDFAEDDVPPMPRQTVAAELDRLHARVSAILEGAERGILQRQGVKVAIVGSPNVGKSSLLNALLSTDRAIVTDIPGTTRDVLEEAFNLDGVPIVLSDTAGIRATTDPIERLGVERSGRALAGADVALAVLDAGRPLVAMDRQMLRDVIGLGKPAVVALNKRDLPRALEADAVEALVPGAIICHTAATVPDISDLLEALRATVGLSAANGTLATVASVRHKDALLHARDGIGAAQAAVREGLASDFVTVGLYSAVHALGEITGDSATEDLLDTIFSKFCIGK